MDPITCITGLTRSSSQHDHHVDSQKRASSEPGLINSTSFDLPTKNFFADTAALRVCGDSRLQGRVQLCKQLFKAITSTLTCMPDMIIVSTACLWLGVNSFQIKSWVALGKDLGVYVTALGW